MQALTATAPVEVPEETLAELYARLLPATTLPCVSCGHPTVGRVEVWRGGHGFDSEAHCRPAEGCNDVVVTL